MISESERKLPPLFHKFFIQRNFSQKVGDAFLVLPSLKSPRLVVPLTKYRIYRRAFRVHNTASVKNQVLKYALKFGYPVARYLRHRILFPSAEFARFSLELNRRLKYPEKLFPGIYVGSPGKSQKMTWQLMTARGEVVGYAKIGDTPESTQFIQNEYEVSHQLETVAFHNAEFPQNLFWGKIDDVQVLVQSPLTHASRFSGLDLSEKLILFLAELNVATRKSSLFGNVEFTKNLVKSLKSMHGLPTKIIADLMGTIKQLSELNVPFGLCHGDFVPYNVRLLTDRLFVLDWEFARQNYPPFFDAFHFLFQGYFQIQRMFFEKIIKEKIFSHRQNYHLIKTYAKLTGMSDEMIPHFFKLYLFDSLVFDLANRPQQKIETNHFYQALNFVKKFFSENNTFPL